MKYFAAIFLLTIFKAGAGQSIEEVDVGSDLREILSLILESKEVNTRLFDSTDTLGRKAAYLYSNLEFQRNVPDYVGKVYPKLSSWRMDRVLDLGVGNSGMLYLVLDPEIAFVLTGDLIKSIWVLKKFRLKKGEAHVKMYNSTLNNNREMSYLKIEMSLRKFDSNWRMQSIKIAKSQFNPSLLEAD